MIYTLDYLKGEVKYYDMGKTQITGIAYSIDIDNGYLIIYGTKIDPINCNI